MDESTLREIDKRVRAALRPASVTADQVAQRALSENPVRKNDPSRFRYRVAVATAMFLLALGMWHWRAQQTTMATPSLSLVGRGSTVIVESADGRRWLVGPAPERRPGGNYVIVLGE
jgi:hypothetical protein